MLFRRVSWGSFPSYLAMGWIDERTIINEYLGLMRACECNQTGKRPTWTNLKDVPSKRPDKQGAYNLLGPSHSH